VLCAGDVAKAEARIIVARADNAIEIRLAGGAATSATFNDQVVLDDSVTINSAGANGITFADLVDSIGAEANDLTVNITGGETTTFVGAVGSGDISDLTGGVATNALGLGNLRTDMTAFSGVNANGSGSSPGPSLPNVPRFEAS